MKKKFIPIIGTISAGKSTFLQGLLGTNVFETGSTTTTKFVCLIKNNNQTKFYHVIPKRENGIEFIKKGDEIIGEENIKNKIKEINQSLSNKPVMKDDIFYMLEIPIKNIDNVALLQENYFMDIPGLNEDKSSYIEIIFSILTLDDINFEIILFDSTCIGSDNILNIFKRLEEKKCLKKSDNIFILNKIDQANENEEEVINKFKQYFYENFEDDKDKKNLIEININENKLIPMNSILYLAETKIKEDFCSMLIFELITVNSSKDKAGFDTFYEYIEKKVEFTLKWVKDQNHLVNLDTSLITEEEYEIIKNSIEALNNINKIIIIDFSINIDLDDEDIKDNMIKLFLLHKDRNVFYIHSKYYNELQQIIKEIKINNNVFNFDIINIDNQNNENSNNIIKSLDEFDNFLRDAFQIHLFKV